MTTEPADLTKLSFNATPRAVLALETTADFAGLTPTDTAGRAFQVYAAVMRMPLWAALKVLVRERAEIRRIAAGRKARP